MAEPDERALLAGALQSYLEELRDTGVDSLSFMESRPLAVKLSEPAVEAAAWKPAGTKETLEAIRCELGECRRCNLCATRNNIVFGVGSQNAGVIFVGEAPGMDEDTHGEPFVGEAGQLLTNMIKAMGYERSEVYICNVIKCRPPENRSPAAAEIAQCSPFLLRQIQAIAPKVIVTLGTCAAQTLLQSQEPVSRLRGQFHDYRTIPLMPTFHPAFLLRSPEKKREAWADLQQVMKFMLI